MTHSNNPTSASAVIGEEIVFATPPGGRGALLKALTMPLLLTAFAAYLVFGIFTMRVPAGAAFPGPQFFPSLIAAGLVLFAVLLTLSAFRDARAEAGAAADLEEGRDPVVYAADLTEQDASATDSDVDPAAAPSKAVRVDWRSFAWVVLSFLGFALLLPVLGWIIAAGLLFWCIARGFGNRAPLAPLVVGLRVSSIVYIAFDMVLGMNLPSGVLGWGF